MKTKLMKRLRSRAGESISEVLIAMLISVLALTMLAAMLSSTVSMVERSKATMNLYYEGNEVLEVQEASEDTVTVSVKSSSVSKVNAAADVNLYKNEVFHNNVYAYQIKKSDG